MFHSTKVAEFERDSKGRAVEERPSETAMGAAFLRALAFTEGREEIRGSDCLAHLFLSDEQRSVLERPMMKKRVMKQVLSPGKYEYILARSAFFDHIVEKALKQNVPQIVFLGAGYDTRSYRFRGIIKGTRIFELDIHTTQAHKQELLGRMGMPVPPQVVFVPINFKTDSLEQALLGAGFDRRAKTTLSGKG
jgi:methyltransferase (TIGR00027 family)